jgi:hypothetical protein
MLTCLHPAVESGARSIEARDLVSLHRTMMRVRLSVTESGLRIAESGEWRVKSGARGDGERASRVESVESEWHVTRAAKS